MIVDQELLIDQIERCRVLAAEFELQIEATVVIGIDEVAYRGWNQART